MNIPTILRRHAAVVLATGLFFVQQVAQACPAAAKRRAWATARVVRWR